MDFEILDNLTEIITKGTTPTSLGKNFTSTGTPFLRAQNIKNGKVIINDDILYIDESTHNNELKRSQIKEGDLLLTIAGTIGRTAMVKELPKSGLNSNQAVALIRINDPRVYKPYLQFYFSSNSALNQIRKSQVTATISNLSLGQIKKLKIPLPSIKSQHRIASILDDADILRFKSAQLLKEYELLAQSLFLDMFGDPYYNTKNFKRITIGEIANIVGGSQPPKKVFKNEPTDGYVRLVQIRDYKSDRFLTFVPEKSTKKFCTEEDIMIGRYGPPVFQILRGISGAYNVALMKATPRKIIHKEYLFYLLSSTYIQGIIIGNSQRTAGQTGVNLKLLNKIEVNLPPIELQNQFAEKIAIIEQQKELAKQELQESEDLFNCLLQKAFKGELK